MIKKYIFIIIALLLFAAGAGFFELNAAAPPTTGGHAGYAAAETKNGTIRRHKRKEQRISFKWHQRNLERHFHKHRRKFPEYKTVQAYGNGALKFFSDPPPGTKFKRRPNGDRLFYCEKSNLFGVTTKDGFVKTFFRPDRGIRYWNRQ